MHLEYLVFVGAMFSLLAGIPYIRNTLLGKTKPHLVTWGIWATAPFIATAAAISKGVGWAVLPVFMSGFVPALIVITALVSHHKIWKPSRFDLLCGTLSIAALLGWWITKEANIAIAFSIASDGLAGLPTLRKSWKYPESETGVGYTVGVFTACTAFAAAKQFDFATIAPPIYFILMNGSLSFAVYRHRILSFFR